MSDPVRNLFFAAFCGAIAGLSAFSLFRSVSVSIEVALAAIAACDFLIRWRNDDDARYPLVHPEVGIAIDFVPLWIAALAVGVAFGLMHFNVRW